MKNYNILEFAQINFPFAIDKGTHRKSFFPHTHDFIELEIVTGGKANHVVEGKTYPLVRGDVIVMLPSYIHALQDVFELEVYNIKFDLEKLLLLDADIENLSGFQSLFKLQPFNNISHDYTSHMHLNEEQLFYVKTICELIYEEWMNKSDGYNWVIKSYFLALITFLSRNYSPSIIDNSPIMHNVAKSIAFIHENLSKKITVSMLANISFLSARQYSRVFKDAYGASPIEYIIRCRLSLACKLMKSTEKSLAEISLFCGFSDKTQFYRLFKKRYSITPNQYRKQKML